MKSGKINDWAYGISRYARISPEQCERLHLATLEALERTGVRLHDGAAVDLLARAGARVQDDGLVRIPAALVERALETAPKRLTLFDRQGEAALHIEDHNCYYGPGSDALNIVDHTDGVRRAALLRDVYDGVTLVDALPNVNFVMSMYLPSDVDQRVYELYQMEAMLNRTTKPIIIVTHDLPSLAACVEMAEAVAGGAEVLREKPFVTCYINVTTGLRHNEEALQKLMYLAGKGLPSLYIPVCYGGLTAPSTLAGTVVASNMGVLTGVVISQLVREGAPLVVPGWGARTINMATGATAYFTPDDKGLMAAMAHYYHLPMFGYGGFSDSKVLDGQAGLEAAVSLTFATLQGANLIHDMGYLEAGVSGALGQLALCDEMIGWLGHAFGRVDIDEETLALDVIDEKGPDGNYLDHDHTLRHYRERWLPGLLDQFVHATWQERGAKSLAERATGKVAKILAKHQPVPLSAGVQAQVHQILEREIAQLPASSDQ